MVRAMRCASNSEPSETDYYEPIGDVAAAVIMWGYFALWLLIYCIIPFVRTYRSSGGAA